MEAADPAPEDGADLESRLGPGGSGSAAVGGDESLPLPEETERWHAKTLHDGALSHQHNGQDSASDLAAGPRSEKNTTAENGGFDCAATDGAPLSLENGSGEADVDGTPENQNLLEEAGAARNLLPQNHRPWEADIEDNPTQNHRPGEVNVEEVLEGIARSLTLQNHMPEDDFEGYLPHQNHGPDEAGVDDSCIAQNGHAESSIEVSLAQHNYRPEEAEMEDTLATHNNQPEEAGIEETIATENHILPEADITENHRLEQGVTEETRLSPNQGVVDSIEETLTVPQCKVHEDPDLGETQNHNLEEATAPQEEPSLEGSLTAKDDLSQACQQVLEQDGEESSDQDLTDSASTDNTLEDSTVFSSNPILEDSVAEGPIPSPPIHQDEDITADGWRARRKHVFVLSEAGKPIYSRYGNEEALSSTMGVMMALVSFVQSGNNIIRSIYSGDHKVVFVQKGPLVLVSVSRTLQSEPQLRRELHYVYYQIISMLTQGSVERIFEHKKNYDLRRLLSGSEKILDSLLNLVDIDASFLLGAVQCLPLATWVRDALNAILLKAITPNLVFSILLANSQLVTIVQEKAVIEDCLLEPTDLLLLLNLIRSSSAFQAGEIWTPICLPRFNPDGYFYAYISYLDPECTVCLILLSTDKDSFYSVSACKKRIDENLRTQNLLQAIDVARQSPSYSASLVGVPDLRHFIFKPLDIPDNYKQLTQFTSPEAEGPYCDEEERQRLFDLYRYLHSRIHSSSRPLKLIYHVAEKETLLAWVTSKFELYTSYSPLVTKTGAINVITKLLRWIKKEEDRLFIRYPPKYSTTPVPGKGTKGGKGSADKIDTPDNGFFSGL